MSPSVESDLSWSTATASSRRCGVVVESAERRHLGVGEQTGSEHGRIPVTWTTSQGRACTAGTHARLQLVTVHRRRTRSRGRGGARERRSRH